MYESRLAKLKLDLQSIAMVGQMLTAIAIPRCIEELLYG